MPLPERLGKYTIQGILGKGAMGVVYKGYDPGIRRQVAIKTIRKDLMEDSATAGSMTARFRNEAQAAGALTHPGIVAVYDYGEDADLAYIAMEYVEGNSIREYFHQKRAFSIADVVSLMAQLLDALDAAHQHAIWHRDIKPANLIITSKGRLKVADFGIARIEASELTRAGDIMGTPGYMAPELYRGDPVDHRVDLFAAGVVMYHLIAGKAPFNGMMEAITYQVLYENPASPSLGVAPHDWAPYDPVVATAMSKQPEQRFATAGAFREALLAVYSRTPNATLAEDTIIPAIASTPIDVRRADASAPAGRPITGNTSAPTGWDASLILDVERALTQVIGPLAKIITQRSARQCSDISALIENIAAELDDPDHRRMFRQSMYKTPPGTGSAGTRTSSAKTSVSDTLNPETLSRATDALVSQIGPIARVVVARAAKRAATLAEFHQLIANEIVSERDRNLYLQKVGQSGHGA